MRNVCSRAQLSCSGSGLDSPHAASPRFQVQCAGLDRVPRPERVGWMTAEETHGAMPAKSQPTTIGRLHIHSALAAHRPLRLRRELSTMGQSVRCNHVRPRPRIAAGHDARRGDEGTRRIHRRCACSCSFPPSSALNLRARERKGGGWKRGGSCVRHGGIDISYQYLSRPRSFTLSLTPHYHHQRERHRPRPPR